MLRCPQCSPLFCAALALFPGLQPAPVAAVESAFLRRIPVATGLSSPLGIAHAGDGSGRLFLVERCGRIKILAAGAVLPTPFLDLGATGSDLIVCGGERGLLGLAFHPIYETNGTFYVNYTRKADGATVVARFEVSADPNVANPGSHDVVLVIPQPFGNHNGGNLQFGPDGYLYVGMGDGGGGGDPQEQAQDLGSLLGKMLRIDIDADDFPGDPNRDYAIPPTNPFAGPIPGADEIWAYGLRNPWRWSFDRLTGDLYIGDVGQGPGISWEEASRQPAASPGGENYGWDVLEGGLQPGPPGADHPNCFEDVPAGSCGDFLSGGSTLPILEYSSADGTSECAITGGYVYRGSTASTLAGEYVYADYCSGKIWRAEESGGEWTPTLAFDTPFLISSFGEDEDGKLYFSDLGGGVIQRIAPHSFQDVQPTAFGWSSIETLYLGEITSGCATGPLRYCPGAHVRRQQMAVFLLAAAEGPGYTPPACVAGDEIFDDVPAASVYCRWIEEVYRRGITAGCSVAPPLYCPGNVTRRNQMAVFLLTAAEEPGYQPPACVAGQEAFDDVPAASVFCRWIEEAHRRGITNGCSATPPRYCPANHVTRAQLAVLLVAAFELPTSTP